MRRRWVLVLLLLGASASGGDREGIDYGAYVPFVVEDQRASVDRHVRALFDLLVVPACPKCFGAGKITVQPKKLDTGPGRPGGLPQPDPDAPKPKPFKKTCPTCDGNPKTWRWGQRGGPNRKFLEAALDPRAKKAFRSRWLRRLQGLKEAQRMAPHLLLCDVSFRTAIVAAPGHGLKDPLEFRRHGGRWVLRDEKVHGKLAPHGELPWIRSTAKVLEVLAADVLRLDVHDNTIVRVCGVFVPQDDKLVATGFDKPNEKAREVVRKWIEGKTVTLMHDDYARMTTSGRPIVYVAFDDHKDLGEELLREGIALRLRPPSAARFQPPAAVVHIRARAYEKAEARAREKKRGWWKEHPAK